jgi:hypothetical protein
MGGGSGLPLLGGSTSARGVASHALYATDGPFRLGGVDEEIAEVGRGLFMLGGNPLYYTAKGMEKEVVEQMHRVMKMNSGELGGHHVLMVVGTDGGMYVQRTPLSGRMVWRNTLPKAGVSSLLDAVEESLPTQKWLAGVQLQMLKEDILIRKLYPKKGTALPTDGLKHWSCPLRRLGFWNNLPGNFF